MYADDDAMELHTLRGGVEGCKKNVSVARWFEYATAIQKYVERVRKMEGCDHTRVGDHS